VTPDQGAGDGRALRVLHIIESFGGGSASAVEEYVRSTPELHHSVLYGSRPDSARGEDALRRFQSAAPLGTGLQAVTRIRQEVRRLDVDVVHAHSSFAGLYARNALLARRTPVVYTPHCFAFERRDLPPAVRGGIRAAEFVLARNTSVFAACSNREGALARSLRRRARVHVVPNVADASQRPADSGKGSRRGAPVIATNGRIGAQKDPAFFLATVRRLRERAPDVRAIWIGGGDAAEEARLRASGVEVTGWIPREEAVDRLGQADLYIHTAAWEGFPMAVLEASALELPIVARSIDALEITDRLMGAPSPELLADCAWKVLSDESVARRNRALWERKLAGNTRAAQRTALEAAYREAVAGAGRIVG
jgi:glycosyltransferase involved in cell wall biosynthesis